LVYSINAEENIENSSIAAHISDLLAASVEGTWERFGVRHVSPELYLGTRVKTTDARSSGLGLVRGVTVTAPLVRRSVRIVTGDWPSGGEVIVGRLVAAKLGVPTEAIQVGEELSFEGRRWRISGQFSADGASYESEIWCPLDDFQQATKRQDL